MSQMSGEGNYVCTLSQKTLEKARKELHEDPKQRASQIETLRHWVKSQPHLRSRTGTTVTASYTFRAVVCRQFLTTCVKLCLQFCFVDDHFLLRFLRAAKFSQLRAQQVLENYWTVRSVTSKGAPDWFENLTPSDPRLQEVLSLGYIATCSLIDNTPHDFSDTSRFKKHITRSYLTFPIMTAVADHLYQCVTDHIISYIT